MKVCDKMCDECLFTNNKIVSDKRKPQLLGEIFRKDSYFICHKSSINGYEQFGSYNLVEASITSTTLGSPKDFSTFFGAFVLISIRVIAVSIIIQKIKAEMQAA